MNGICPCERPLRVAKAASVAAESATIEARHALICLHRPWNAREAARSFTDLLAKSKYGGGGQCTFLDPIPGSVLAFQALIGNFRAPGVTANCDVSISVEQQEN